jgi:chaperonin cofactor prefoldin
MKNLFLIVLSLGLLAGCSEDRLQVIHNNDRVTELERRAALNDATDAAQSELIAINDQRITVLEGKVTDLENATAALQAELDAEEAARAAGDAALADLINQEAAARAAGDQANADALSAAIAQQTAINNLTTNKINTINALLAAQAVIDVLLQFQISQINSKFPTINSKLNSLQSQINNANSDINALEAQMAGVQSELSGLQSDLAAVNSNVSDLGDALTELEARVAALEATDPVPGPQGPAGPAGPQGPAGTPGVGGATVVTISLSGSPSCKSTGVGSIYARRDGERVKLYGSLNDCNDMDDKIAELDPTPQSGQNAYFWLSSTKMAVTDSSSSANLKVLSF